MTKQEWLIHILNGGKGTSNFTDKGEYVYFKNGNFHYTNGNLAGLSLHRSNFAKYEEPNKMIKIAPYLFKYDDISNYFQTSAYFKNDAEFKILYYGDTLAFQRLTALEIEVEDYEQN